MKRREFVSTPLVGAAMSASSALAQETPRYDTVLKGGHVIDLANQINRQMDVALLDGKIARVDRNIPDSAGKRTINVAGYYITPGLIDLHICCYYTRLDLTPSVIADHLCLPSGVTTCCDGGTAGANNFEDFKKIIDRSKMRILSFLNIAAPGAESNRAEQDPTQFKVQLAADTAKKYPALIVGFKTGHYGGTFSETRLPWASVDAVVEAGRQRDDTAPAQQPEGRLVADDAAVGRGQPDGASSVGAEGAEGHAGGDGRAGSGARSSRRAFGIPRVAGRRKLVGQRRGGEPELVRRQLPGDHGARGAGAANEGRRILCDMSRQQARASRGRPKFVEVLEGNRHPVESSEPAPIPDLFLRLPGFGQRGIGKDHVVGPQRRVQGLDPTERGARDLDR